MATTTVTRDHWLGQTIAVHDISMYYETHGEGPPLICLHNFSANGRSRFAALLPQLTKHFTCYLVDLRGHGRSTNPSGVWTHEQSSRDIIALIGALEIEQAHFLAASSGGMSMLRVARYAPKLIRAMVIDSATYRVPRESGRFYKAPDTLSPKLKRYYEDANEVHGPEHGRILAETFYSFRLPEADVNVQLALLGEIQSPTLIIHGDRDDFFPAEIAVEMHRTIRGSELLVFPETKHIVMEAHPEVVARETLRFFERVSQREKERA